jgi:hypothetical protein
MKEIYLIKMIKIFVIKVILVMHKFYVKNYIYKNEKIVIKCQ